MRFFLFLAILTGFGCATAMPKFPADQSFVDFPAAGNLERVTSARVGDSVVEKAKFFKRPAKLLSSEILDVVDATNTEIRYKLLSGFPNYE